MARIDLAIETPDGALRTSIEIPERAIGLGELARLFLPLDDRATHLAVERSARGGRPISCREGCASCCRQLVPVSPAEAFLIADVVDALPERRRGDVDARFERARDALERSWIGYALRHRMAEDPKRAAELAIGYHRLGLDCPFLVDERCSIYDDRPPTCREYVVTTPREACATLGRAPVSRVPIALRLSDALAAVAADRLGRAPEPIVLPQALAWARANDDARRRTWAARPMVEAVLAALAT